THRQLQPAVEVLALPGVERQVVAADGRAPPLVADQRFITEARKMLGQLLDAMLDVLGQFETVLRVQAAKLFLAPGGFGPRSRRDVMRSLPALDRSFQPLVEIHHASGFDSCGASSGPSDFNSKNCFKSPNVRRGSLPDFMALVKGTSGLGLG